MENKTIHQFAMRISNRHGYTIVIVTAENDVDVDICNRGILHGKVNLLALKEHEIFRLYELRRKALQEERA